MEMEMEIVLVCVPIPGKAIVKLAEHVIDMDADYKHNLFFNLHWHLKICVEWDIALEDS